MTAEFSSIDSANFLLKKHNKIKRLYNQKPVDQ